jgi:hypothetical protein
MTIEYESSALLSYEVPHQFLADAGAPSDVPTVRIAESVLSTQTLEKLAQQLGSRASAAALRSHFELLQPGPELLQVTYRGNDQKQVVTATNALAGVLAAWVAAPETRSAPASSLPTPTSQVEQPEPPAPASPKPPATTAEKSPNVAGQRRRLAVLRENSATLALQQRSIEQRISALLQQRRTIQSGTQLNPSTTDPRGQTPSATTKELAQLRELRTAVLAEQRSNAEKAQKLTTQRTADAETPATPPAPSGTPAPTIATPPVSRPPNHDQDATSPAWQGSFSVVDWGEKPHPVGGDPRRLLLWLGAVASILSAALYVAFAAWRYRSIQDLASLRRALPRDTRYFGAVAGTPLREKSS